MDFEKKIVSRRKAKQILYHSDLIERSRVSYHNSNFNTRWLDGLSLFQKSQKHMPGIFYVWPTFAPEKRHKHRQPMNFIRKNTQ